MIGFTEEQKERFIIYLTECHSWHKHLSLLHGGQFLIILDKNTGTNYPEKHPLLPFGNTLNDYQKAFGHLTYFWKDFKDFYFKTDGKSENYTEDDLVKKYQSVSKVQLFPYISNDFSEAINFHNADLDKIFQGQEHEESVILSKILLLYNSMNEYWETILNNEERDLVVSDNIENESTKLSQYKSIENQLVSYLNQLKQKEVTKIRMAIEEIKNGF